MLAQCIRGLILSAFLISLCFGKSIPDSKRMVQDVFTINTFGECYYIESDTQCYYDQYTTLTIARSLLTGEVEYLIVKERYEQNPSDHYYYINFEHANLCFNSRQIKHTGKITGTKEYLQAVIDDIVKYPAQYPEMNVLRPYWHNNNWFDKVKNIIVRYQTILQRRNTYLFLGSVVHLEEGDCDEN